MRNPLKLLIESPHYIFGRFESFRSAYSVARRVQQNVKPSLRALRICDKYQDNWKSLAVAPSNAVRTDVAAEVHVTRIRETAFSGGLRLSEQACQGLIEISKTMPLTSNQGPLPKLDALFADAKLRERTAIATVPDSSAIALVQAIAADPMVMEVVEKYLGYFPTEVASWLFWSLANSLSDHERERVYQTVRFHYDVQSFNFLYVNFYLLDTDEEAGPHVLISGSHRRKALKHLFGSTKITDEDAIRFYGRHNIQVITGRAGEGFFEDTSCYHKACPPRLRPRFMLQLRYS